MKSLVLLIDGCESPTQVAQGNSWIQPYLIVSLSLTDPSQMFVAAECQLLCEVGDDNFIPTLLLAAHCAFLIRSTYKQLQ
jgi:hypothetical protein